MNILVLINLIDWNKNLVKSTIQHYISAAPPRRGVALRMVWMLQPSGYLILFLLTLHVIWLLLSYPSCPLQTPRTCSPCSGCQASPFGKSVASGASNLRAGPCAPTCSPRWRRHGCEFSTWLPSGWRGLLQSIARHTEIKSPSHNENFVHTFLTIH